MRAISLRYVLGGEFRSDLTGAPAGSLEGIHVPRTKENETAIRDMAQRLRTSFADAYAELADQVEGDRHLSSASIAPETLGAIDTFRFEERILLTHCGHLIAKGDFGVALNLIAQREKCFWLDRDIARRAQWEACRLLAELGKVAAEVGPEGRPAGGKAGGWVTRYIPA